MEGGVSIYRPASPLLDLLQAKRGQDGWTIMKNFVSKNKGETFELKQPHVKWTVGGLDETIYKDMDEVVDGWGKFYLPKEVRMQVVGVVEGSSCPSDQLVLMFCENGKMYAYAEEELHMVASSPKQLSTKGMEFPSSKRYYEGEAFKHMTEDDWDEVKKGEVGRHLDEEHRELVASRKDRFLANLKAHSGHHSLHSTAGKRSGEVLECGALQTVGVKRGRNRGASQSSQWRGPNKVV